MRTLLLTVSLFIGGTCFGQHVNDGGTTPNHDGPLKQVSFIPEEETYEILANPNLVVELTPADYDKINAARKVNEVVIIELNQYVRVKVLPYNTIRKKKGVEFKATSHE